MGKASNLVPLDKAISIAVSTALDHMEKEKAKQKKERHYRRLRNIKLLLKNYRSFKLHCYPVAKEEIEQLDDTLISDELDKEELALESIKKSRRRTIALVNYIDRMLLIYKIVCEQSGKEEELRRYRIIEQRFLEERENTVDEIARGQNIDNRTVYKDINKASQALAALIFGADGVRLFE